MCKTGASIEKKIEKQEFKTEEIKNQSNSNINDSVMPNPLEMNKRKEKPADGMKAEKEWAQKGLQSYVSKISERNKTAKKNYEFDEKTAAMYMLMRNGEGAEQVQSSLTC